MRAFLTSDDPEAELDKTGCKDCDAHDYCWNNIPEGAVFEVLRSNKARQFIREGMPCMKDLPPNSFDNENYNHWVEVYRTGRPYINHEAISQWLNRLEYPLYYLDFETAQPVVPLWKYRHPYQQIPFQFFLHIQAKPNGEFIHKKYLFEGKADPRYDCVKALLEYISPKGTVIAHNASFEKTRIKEMESDLPFPQEQKDELLK